MMRCLFMVLIAPTLALAACTKLANVQCEQSSNCNLSGGGVCTAAPTGNSWCAYPDPGCPSGYRYSTQATGDGVSGACVMDVPIDASVGPAVDAAVSDGPSPDGPVPFGAVAFTVGGNTPSGADVPNVIVSSGSDIIVSGALNQAADLGGGARMGDFVAKYNSSGTHLWSRSWNFDVTLRDVRVHPDGDVLLTGELAKGVDFGCGLITPSANGDLIVVKLNGSNGTCRWSTRATGSEHSQGDRIATVGSDVFVAGTFGSPNNSAGGGTLVLGSTSLVSAAAQDIFVARFQGATGAPVWASSIPGTKNEYVTNIVAVGSDSFAIAGFLFGNGSSLTLGGSTFTKHLFAARFKADGSGVIWAQQYGNVDDEATRALSLMTSGDLVLAADFTSSAAFGATTLQGTGLQSAAVARLDAATGVPVWAKSFSAATRATATRATVGGLTTLPGGNIVGALQFTGTVTVGAQQLDSGSGQAIAVIQLASDGQPISAKRYGGGNELDSVTAAGAVASGEVLLTGTFDHSIDFGASAPLSSMGSRTIFASRVSP